MVLRRPNLKDIVSDRNYNFLSSSILEKFCRNQFLRITYHYLKDFVRIDFCESTFLGVQKGI